MPSVLLVFLICAVGVLGDVFLKLSGSGPKGFDWRLAVLGVAIMGASVIGVYFAFKQMKFASFGVLYSLGTILIMVLVGLFYFKERLTLPEMVGVAAACVAVALLGRFA